MSLTPQELTILGVFDRALVPRPRFQQIACPLLQREERSAATRSLVAKGILAPLADGEFWLTDAGLVFLNF